MNLLKRPSDMEEPVVENQIQTMIHMWHLGLSFLTLLEPVHSNNMYWIQQVLTVVPRPQ